LIIIELFLLVLRINDEQKRAVLLHVSGKQVRDVFNTLDDVETSYKEACEKQNSSKTRAH